MKFTRTEVRDIAIATLVLAFAFGNVLGGGLGGYQEAIAVVLIAFLPHELLGHKLVAQRMGAEAEFRMWPTGLLLAFMGSLVGFVFAAPGAVYFSPVARGQFAWNVHRFTKKEVGKIGLAGPAVNLIIGSVAAFAGFATGMKLLSDVAMFSFFLAFFNLIPIAPIDGQKVFEWDRRIWGVSIAAAAAGYLLLPLA